MSGMVAGEAKQMEWGPRQLEAQDGIWFEWRNRCGEDGAFVAGEPGPDEMPDEGERDGVMTGAALETGLAETMVATVGAAVC